MRGWCSKCKLPCSLDMCMFDMHINKIVCYQCSIENEPKNLRPLIAATLDDGLASGSATSMLVMEHKGYALVFRVPFYLEYYIDTVVMGNSTMPSSEKIRELDVYAESLDSEVKEAMNKYPEMKMFDNRDKIGKMTTEILERPDFANSKYVRETLCLTPIHARHFVASGVAHTFKTEITHMKECPIGAQKTRIAVVPSVPEQPKICLPQASAFCELKVRPAIPGKSVIVSCAQLDLLFRVVDKPVELVPSVVAFVSRSGWHAGVFELGAVRALVGVSAGIMISDPLTAVQWPLKVFVSSEQLKRHEKETRLYDVEERRRAVVCQTISPLKTVDISTVSICIMLNMHTAMLIGSLNDGSAITGMTLSNKPDQNFSVFIKWTDEKWAHLLCIDDLIVLIDGDILFNVHPTTVSVCKMSAREVCPFSLTARGRMGAIEWTLAGWCGKCPDIFCNCQIMQK